MNDSTDMRHLFAEYASGEISARQLHLLEAALREDTELRRDFIEYMNVDSALGDMAALSDAEFEATKPDSGSETTADRVSGENATSERLYQIPRIVAIPGALVTTLLFAAILWFASLNRNERASVATLVMDVDAVLVCNGDLCKGAEIPAGKYQLKQGLLHLQFAGGVMVYVEAPARFDAVSDKRVMLHSGRLSATVPPEGVGFTVETPGAEVVDFGTEFSIDVEGGASEVHVFDGLVRVNPGAENQRDVSKAVDLQASQAVRIIDGAAELEDISIATERFIRNFDEPRLNYARAVRRLSPLAHYRMPIRDHGLVSEPPEYSGIVLTGEGKRPPHARGVFVGGSLRVGADSTGRGGRVDSPPALNTRQFSLAVFVYLEEPAKNAVVATNLDGDRGNFRLSLDDNGMLKATIRNSDGDMSSITGASVLSQNTWRHVVLTADGEQQKFYEDGKLVSSGPCAAVSTSNSATIWFGTNARATMVWDGRIDEVALFNRALTAEETAALYRTAQKEIARSR